MSRRPSTPSLLRLAFAALAPALLCAGLAAQAQDFPIGSKGASVQLEAPWQRKTLDKDLGEDQFQRSERRGFFARGSEVYVVLNMKLRLVGFELKPSFINFDAKNLSMVESHKQGELV